LEKTTGDIVKITDGANLSAGFNQNFNGMMIANKYCGIRDTSLK
jgi:hypothetical protein